MEQGRKQKTPVGSVLVGAADGGALGGAIAPAVRILEMEAEGAPRHLIGGAGLIDVPDNLRVVGGAAGGAAELCHPRGRSA